MLSGLCLVTHPAISVPALTLAAVPHLCIVLVLCCTPADANGGYSSDLGISSDKVHTSMRAIRVKNTYSNGPDFSAKSMQSLVRNMHVFRAEITLIDKSPISARFLHGFHVLFSARKTCGFSNLVDSPPVWDISIHR